MSHTHTLLCFQFHIIIMTTVEVPLISTYCPLLGGGGGGGVFSVIISEWRRFLIAGVFSAIHPSGGVFFIAGGDKIS